MPGAIAFCEVGLFGDELGLLGAQLAHCVGSRSLTNRIGAATPICRFAAASLPDCSASSAWAIAIWVLRAKSPVPSGGRPPHSTTMLAL
jgi:hypothetical protein